PPLVWARPDRLARSRRRAARTRRVPRRVVRRLYAPSWHLLGRSRDEIAAWVVPPRDPGEPGRDDGGPRPAPSASGGGRRNRPGGLPRVLPVLLVTAAVSGAALHRLIGAGAAVGPDLVPAPGTAADLWLSARATWRPSGLGASATADPIDSLLAVLSLPLGGVPGRVVDLLLLSGLPLAALTAWLAAGALTGSRLVRAWSSLVWAASPPLLAALSAGRVGAVLAHVALPAAAFAVARAALDDSPRRRLTAGCAAGLLLTAVLSGAPSLAVAVVVAVPVVAVAALLHGRGALAVPTGVLPALVVPGGLLLPWWLAVAREPRLLLAHAGPAGKGPVTEVWEGLPAGAGQELAHLLSRVVPVAGTVSTGTLSMILAVVLGGPVVLAAAGALLRRGSVTFTAAAAVTGLAGLATALVAVRVEVGAAGSGLDGGSPFAGPAGPGLSLGILGLLAAAVAFGPTGHPAAPPDGGTGPVAGRARRSLRRLMPVAVAAGLLTGPLVVLGGWTWQGVAGPGHLARRWAPAVHRADPDVLPGIAADEAEGAAEARTLVVQDDRSTVRWTLARAAGPRLGDDSAALAALRLDGRDAPWPRGRAASEATVVAPVLAALLGDSSADARGRLAELGIGSVLLVPPVQAATALALDASPGLARVTAGQGAVLWRVDLAAQPGAPARAARARIVDERGFTVSTLASRGDRVDVTVPPAGNPRYVVLTERYHAGWTATLDGRPLRGLPTSGWAQCFDLPAGAGGRLRIEHRVGTPGAADPIALAVAVLALAGLLPVPELRRRLVRPAPPSPSRPVPRAAPTDPDPGPLPPMPRVFDTDHPETGAVAPLFSDVSGTPEARTEERPVAEEDR
ncbi:MAG: glycosyltransferase, partial [Actinomycetota bacterium]|nr:glycosyltransferase [Actinomycetota bacterium]